MNDGAPPKKKKKLIKKVADAPAAAPAADAKPEKAAKSDAAETAGAAAAGSSKKMIIIAAAVSAIMLGVGVGVGMFAAGMFSDDKVAEAGAESADPDADEAEAEEEEEVELARERDDRHSIYVSVGKLLASLEHNGSTRYIQAEMDLVGYNKEVMDEAQHDMPAIRNRLLLLFSSQNFDEVRTIEGREKLRTDSLAAVNDVLQFSPKGDRIEDVYFTAFVIQ